MAAAADDKQSYKSRPTDMKSLSRKQHGTLLLIALAITGCGSHGGTDTSEKGTPGAGPRPSPEGSKTSQPLKRVTNRPGNQKGKVFIVEYHHVRDGKGTMFRTANQFKSDLERYYRLGFRPVTVSQYLDNKMNLAPGASPMVFTFDDSNPSQLQLRPNGTVDPTCAVGIWLDFAKTHPDFPVRATFYVLPDVMWAQPKLLDTKLAMLKKWGCELGNHTMTHPILRKLSDEKVKIEIGEASARLQALGVAMPASLALPFGSSPKNSQLTKEFDYKGRKVQVKAALLVGANPAAAPGDPKLNLQRIPRVQACEGDYGITYWLDLFEKGKVKVYVQP